MRDPIVLITAPDPTSALPQALARRLRTRRVDVELRGAGDAPSAPRPPAGRPEVTITILGPASASDCYRAAFASKGDTLYVAALDETLLVGPRVQGDRGPCHACAIFRMLACRTTTGVDDPDALLRFSSVDAEHPAARARAIEAVVQLLFEGPATAPGPAQVLACTAVGTQTHWVVRRDDCPVCSEHHLGPVLGRPYMPSAAWPGPRVLIDPLCGVVAGVEDLPAPATSPDADVETPCLARATLGNYRLFAHGLDALVTHGKGWRREQARFGALAEALEAYASWCWRPDRLVRATHAALGHLAIDPTRLAAYRPEVEALVPYPPYRDDQAIAWLVGRSLLDGSARMVPAQAVHPRLPDGWQEPALWEPCGSGTASGRDHDAAELAALLEVLERDAFFMAWYCRVPSVALDLRSHPRAAVRALVRQQAAAGVELRAVELPSTSPARVVAAVALRSDAAEDEPAVCMGLGAALTRAEAGERAVLAALQLHAELARGLASPRVRRLRQALVDGEQPVSNAGRHGLWFSHRVGLAAIGRLLDTESLQPAPWGPSEPVPVRVALRTLVEHLRADAVEAVAVEITPPSLAELGWSVVRVIAPDLQPPWFDQRHPRLAPTTERRAAALCGRPVLEPAALVHDIHPLG
jgi:ribosomal protein S12 methylthiotransferase accessory factor